MAKSTFLSSYTFTKCVVGPPQHHHPPWDNEEEPYGGYLVGRLLYCGIWANMVMGHVADFARVQYAIKSVCSLEE